MAEQAVTLRITADAQGVITGVRMAGSELGKLGSEGKRAGKDASEGIDKIGRSLESAKRQLLGFVTGFLGLQQASRLIRATIDNTIRQEQAFVQLEARIKSTGGAAGFTARELAGMASALQDVTTYGDEAVMEMQALLQTFTNLRGGEFERAQTAVLDMATAMGQDLKSAALQVGKALQDPADGLTALQRSGVILTKSQKDLIESMVETGRVAEAQSVILSELERQFGGAAAAARGTFGGALSGLQNAMGDLLEGRSGLNAAAGSIEDLTKRLKDPQVQANIQNLVQGILSLTVSLAEGLVSAVELVGGGLRFLRENQEAVKTVALVLAAAYVSTLIPALTAKLALWKANTLQVLGYTAALQANTVAASGNAAAQVASSAALGRLGQVLGGLIATKTAAATAVVGLGVAYYQLARYIERAEREAMEASRQRVAERQANIEEFLAAQRRLRQEVPAIIEQEIAGTERLLRRAISLGQTTEVERLRGVIAGLKTELQGISPEWMKAAQSADALTEQLRAQIATLQQQTAQVDASSAAAIRLALRQIDASKLTDDARKTIIDLLKELEGLEVALKAKQRSEAAAKAATEAHAQAVSLLGSQFETLQRRYDEAGAVAAEYARIEATLTKLVGDERVNQEQLAKTLEWVARARAEDLRAINPQVRALEELEQLLERQAQTLEGPASRAAREYARELARIAELEATLLELGPPTEDEVLAIARAREQAAAILRQNTEEQEVLGARGIEVASEFDRAWLSGIDSVASAFGDWLTGSIRSFSDFGRQLKDIARRFLADLIAMFARNQILVRLGLGGGLGVPGTAFAGTGGAGLGGMLLGPGGILSGGAGGFLGGAGALASAIPGLGSFGLGMGVSGTLTSGMGLLGGLGASAQFGLANLGAGNIGLGLGALAGPLAAIAGVAALVNRLTGGGLFGTSYRPESSQTTLSLAGGGTAESTLTESRRRSLFRGTRRRETDITDSEAVQAARELFAAIEQVIADAARALQGTAPAMIDAAIRTVVEYDKNGQERSRRILVDVLGRTWEEATVEAAQSRVAAEAIIATIDSILGTSVEAAMQQAQVALPGIIEDGLEPIFGSGGIIAKGLEAASQTMGEASAIAERWRHDAELLLSGAQFLLAAATDIRAGVGLLRDEGGLTDIADLVERLAHAGEDLVHTYARLVGATALYEQALGLMDIAWADSREALIEHASAIADAAGGLERATALWQRFFGAFFSPEELLNFQLGQAQARATSLLEALGIDPATSMQDFRALFESVLPDLSAEAVVQWLEAAAALADVVDLEGALTELREDQARALLDYALAVRELQDELDDARLSPFQQQIREITRWSDEAAAHLHATARAAGLQAAAEEDLALVHQVAAQRVAQAIRQLQSAARALADRLYGSELERIDAQIEALGGVARSHLDGIGAVGRAADDMYRRQLQAIQNIQQWLDNQLLDPNLSSLTPQQRLEEAQRQFDALAAAAAGGDVDALSSLPQAATALLREARDFFASSQDFSDIEAATRAVMRQFAGLDIGTAPADAGGATGGGAIGVSPELQSLYQERDRLLAQIEEDNRRAMAEDLAVMIRDLVSATGQTLEEVAASIRVSIADLVADLGVSLDDMTVTTALQLADVARLMGVNLSELAAQVGVDLGALADRQSLLNQALDETLLGIPDEFRERLLGPLEALRSAVTETDISDAMFDLLGVTDDLPAGIRDLLAPFFDEIDPSPIISELGTLTSIRDLVSEQLQALASQTWLLESILAAVSASNAEAGVPGYETGTGYVPRTGAALLHQGEGVIPAPFNAWLRQHGFPVSGGGGDMTGVERRLDRLAEVMDRRLERVERGLAAVERAERDTGEQIDRASRRSRDAGLAVRG